MKELLNYCVQPRAYADSAGYVVVELEGNETIEDVREKYKSGDGWWATKYGQHRETQRFIDRGKVYTGRLVVVNVRRAYTG